MKNKKTFLYTFLGICLMGVFEPSFADTPKVINVAIFLYEGVELLDFAGPGEVFSSTPGFKAFTVSVDGKKILSQRFVTVQPEFSLANMPSADIIVFPGGNSDPSSRDKQVLSWIQKSASNGTFIMSVCTGAGIIGAAGVLDGLNVTTFHGYIDGLQASLPNTKVLKNTRFVDSGQIITTAGVSAGIDGALHLVSRIRGLDVAKATAYYMEYDKWDPANGRFDAHEKLLREIQSLPTRPEINARSLNEQPAILEGDIKNEGFALEEKGDAKGAIKFFELAIRLYPNSANSYLHLAQLYRKLNRPAPLSDTSFLSMMRSGNVEMAASTLEKEQKAFPGWKFFDENQVNNLGYSFLQNKDYVTAVKIFQLNAKAFPDSFNAFDSLGEGLAASGNKQDAIKNYEKSLALNPDNENARRMISTLSKAN